MTPTAGARVTARSVTLTLVTVLVVCVLVALGIWQWQRGHVIVTEPPAREAAVPVGQVVSGAAASGTPQAALTADEVGRHVTVGGTFDPQADLLVASRRLDGRPGSWALGIVRTPDGSGVPVVRGWVPQGTPAPPLPTGPVVVDGVVQAPEGSDIAETTKALPAGEVSVVSAALLVNVVDYRLANAYVTDSAPAAGLLAVPPTDPGQASRRLDWRNLAYAAQWWVFAAFTVVVWRRALRDDRELAAERAGDVPGGEPLPDEATPDEGVPAAGATPDPIRTTGPGGRDDMSSAR
ncbi:SURF1 family protein [Kineococcus rubinsiae]|uniref:SURF1 family protein n=1 Tax=Kineococcus rubinsiae TaxID=2609562 RepID=UPI0014307BAE|nr:SURF1 family protein [Kineococcus rubinsiae]